MNISNKVLTRSIPDGILIKLIDTARRNEYLFKINLDKS